MALKEAGNRHFLAKPRRLDEARASYTAALDHLPDLPPPRPFAAPAEGSGLQEVTEDEAEAIEAENTREKDTEREGTEQEIRECTKAVYGNLGAVYVAQEEWKEAVDVCTKGELLRVDGQLTPAVKMDPGYLKAVHRRAVANDNLGTWSSMSSAQEGEYARPVLP